ncbi:MAG: ribosome-associated translation inhibitor RaiA [Peptococcaceae bacterium]|nr:ribosome-associated translation inhibitor RaiA [Peptococcaceae bacterium]
MNITIKGRNIEITGALKDYVEKRFSKLEKYFYNEMQGTVTLIVEKDDHRAEATIPLGRYILRAEESSDDMYASIDAICDKIERQVRKYKTRMNRKGKQAKAEPIFTPAPEEEAAEPELHDKISRTKTFTVKPMDAEEAIMQMELVDHDFYVFLNVDTDHIGVVYRRKDGTYGLIDPQR